MNHAVEIGEINELPGQVFTVYLMSQVVASSSQTDLRSAAAWSQTQMNT